MNSIHYILLSLFLSISPSLYGLSDAEKADIARQSRQNSQKRQETTREEKKKEDSRRTTQQEEERRQEARLKK